MNYLLMTAQNALNVNNGTKTMTRRVIKSRIASDWTDIRWAPLQVGDIVGIREPHYKFGYWTIDGMGKDQHKRFIIASDYPWTYYPDNISKDFPICKGISSERGWYLRPGLFMFAQDVRTKVKIINVRAERLQDITESDALAEGAYLWWSSFKDGRASDNAEAKICHFGRLRHQKLGTKAEWLTTNDQDIFAALWDSINGKTHPWDSNPWVWVYSFKRIL